MLQKNITEELTTNAGTEPPEITDSDEFITRLFNEELLE